LLRERVGEHVELFSVGSQSRLARKLYSLHLSHLDVGRLGTLFQVRHAQLFRADQILQFYEPVVLLVDTCFDFTQRRKVELYLSLDVERRLRTHNQATQFPRLMAVLTAVLMEPIVLFAQIRLLPRVPKALRSIHRKIETCTDTHTQETHNLDFWNHVPQITNEFPLNST
jgi:hypothetical protein